VRAPISLTLRARLSLGADDRINRPLRDGPLFLIFPGTSYLATLIGVPPSFVSPFHEKTGRQVDYGGQAGTNLREGTPLVASS
jgi:hypothetical protein